MLRALVEGQDTAMVTGTRLVALAPALMLAVTLVQGCSSDETDQERAVAALKAEMMANAGMTTGKVLDDAQTTCVAHGAVDELGVSTLQDYRLLTDDLRAGEAIEEVTLAPEDADTLATVFTECMDVEAMMERQIITGLDLPRERRKRAVACVRDGVTEEQVTRIMSLEFQGRPAAGNTAYTRLRDALTACLR
jgi:hypothetical protein